MSIKDLLNKGSDREIDREIMEDPETDEVYFKNITLDREVKTFLVQAAASIAFALLGMLHLFDGKIDFVFNILAAICVGYDVLFKAVKDITQKNFSGSNIIVLITLICMMLIKYAAGGVMLVLLYKICIVVLEKVEEKAISDVMDSVSVKCDNVKLLIDNTVVEADVDAVKVGELIVVAPGETMPLDGQVLNGTSNVDVSVAEGRLAIKELKPGDMIFSGSVNKSDKLTIMARALRKDSLSAKMAEIVGKIGSTKSDSEESISRFSQLFAAAAAVLALIIGVIIPAIFKLDYAVWLIRGVTIFALAYSGSFVFSIPAAYRAAAAAGLKKGIVYNSADAVDGLADVSAVVFDKNGTLDEGGAFEVTSVIPVPGLSEERLLLLAAYAAHHYSVPYAKTIIQKSGVKVNPEFITNYREEYGKGINVQFQGTHIITAGSGEYFAALGLECRLQEDISALHIAMDKQYAGSLIIKEVLKEAAADVIRHLKKVDVDRVIMLSSDDEKATETAASALKIGEFYSDCTVEDKIHRIRIVKDMESDDGEVVLVCGKDTDQQVMNAADVTIIMTDLQIDMPTDAADVVTMNSRLSTISEAVSTARTAKKTISQNIKIALGSKIVLLILAAVGTVQPWLVICADTAVSLLGMLNIKRTMKAE